MNNDLDFVSELAEKEAKEDNKEDVLGKLEAFVLLYKERDKKVKELEEELSNAKEAFNEIAMKAIPELLDKYGLSEIKISTGEKVTLKEDINVTIKDTYSFLRFLKERGADDLIKYSYSFGKLPKDKADALYEFLVSNEFEYESDIGVHHQTIKKFVKDLIGFDGKATGNTINRTELPPFISIFDIRKVTIK